MPDAANVDINTQVVGTRPSTPIPGLHFVNVITERGEFNDPKRIITSWAEFKRYYGGLLESSDDPLMCKLILENGGFLRVNRLAHYTDITDRDSIEPEPATKSLSGFVIFDEDLVADNEINLDVDGTAINAVTFDTDNDTTLENLATEIAGHAKVLSAEAGGKDGSKRWVRVNFSEVVEIENISIINGNSQPNVNYENGLAFLNINGEVLFRFKPLAPGDGYNGLQISISKTSATSSQVTITDPNDSTITENHIVSHFADDRAAGPTYIYYSTIPNFNRNSALFEIVDVDEGKPYSEAVHAVVTGTFTIDGGTPGGAIEDTDYTGDQVAKTGIYAFDGYDDGWTITSFGNNTVVVSNKLANYASSRGDLAFVCHLDNSNTGQSEYIAARDEIDDADKYTLFWGGGWKLLHPSNHNEVELPETFAVLSAMSRTHASKGYHYSFSGPNRGLVRGVIGPIRNFGSQALYAELNQLARSQINMAINRDGKNMLWGNFTGQTLRNPESYASILMLIIYIKKTLRPTLEQFIEEPNTISTFARIYETVKPFFETLANQEAFYGGEGQGWLWSGDQDAKSLDDLQVNNPSDIQQGKYKVNFFIKPVNSLQQIDINIIITDAGVSFEDANSLI